MEVREATADASQRQRDLMDGLSEHAFEGDVWLLGRLRVAKEWPLGGRSALPIALQTSLAILRQQTNRAEEQQRGNREGGSTLSIGDEGEARQADCSTRQLRSSGRSSSIAEQPR